MKKYLVLAFGFLLLIIGHYMGLFVAPSESYMQNVGRIFYVHVPTAWVTMVTYLIAFVFAIRSLWTGLQKWDAYLEATIEVGILLNILLTIQGAIWAKPTWGVWWTWDPRLTTNVIMLVSFLGVLLFRASISSIEKRGVMTAVGSIIAFVNVIIVYESVNWWKSLHQTQSSPQTVSEQMLLPLRLAAFGMLFISIGLILVRGKIALQRLKRDTRAPDLPSNDDKKPLEV
jgi:heme exporter protein C